MAVVVVVDPWPEGDPGALVVDRLVSGLLEGLPVLEVFETLLEGVPPIGLPPVVPG